MASDLFTKHVYLHNREVAAQWHTRMLDGRAHLWGGAGFRLAGYPHFSRCLLSLGALLAHPASDGHIFPSAMSTPSLGSHPSGILLSKKRDSVF